MRSYYKELVRIGASLELTFGLVDLIRMMLFAAGLTYFFAEFIPLTLPVIMIPAALAVGMGLYTVLFIARRAVNDPESIGIGRMLTWSKIAIVDAVTALIVADVLTALSSGLLALSLYLYARELVKEEVNKRNA
ncbi:hypothetical protein GCM10007981_04430 [Thermocladium modestius]|uniref:Uncharacterized protein n=1 Tax=Thermocladium modestius TaxID=62609 RepID=A0A830GWI6_9CREN|nr:hypothetical protein [Thermocladium modestius]GGP19698.1 hypothetical protein GCM10007981_04430 [Thermocladium modestius]